MKTIKQDRFEEGQRVQFKRSLDLYPDAFIEAGEFGTVWEQSKGAFLVLMDKVHDGLGHWDNCVDFTDDPSDSVSEQIKSVK